MQERKFVVQVIMIAIGLIYVIRLFFLQVLDSSYKIEAEINAIEKVVDYPYRGLIYDRNNDLLVFNTPVFDITVVTKEFKLTDTILFCNRFGIAHADFKKLMSDIKNPIKNRGYSRNKPQTLFKQLSLEDFAHVQDYMQDYPGLYTQARTVRSYSYSSTGNALGYIGEISSKSLEKQTDSYYKQGDYIGLSGLEQYYEKELRGKRGVKYIMKDVHGVLKGKYRGGAYDTISAPGENLVSTLDIKLQQYGELLLQNKIGCVVIYKTKLAIDS